MDRDYNHVYVFMCVQVQFYADIIDVIIGWLDRSFAISWPTTSPHAALLPFTAATGDLVRTDARLTGLLQAYGYLVAAISYLGAEQALCSVFHSFVCFSHRETFYYANFSFAGEAVFRLYRHSYPLDVGGGGGGEPRRSGWRTDEHAVFFPELTDCRQDIIADLDYIGTLTDDYIGMSTDPSLCAAVRKNETRFFELDQLTVDEVERLVGDIRRRLDAAVTSSRLRYIISGVLATAAVVYTALATLTHCVTQSRCASDHCCAANHRKRKPNEHLLEASSIYAERPADRTPTSAAADNSCCTPPYGADVEQTLSELTTTTPSRTLTANLSNDISLSPTTECNHRHHLTPPPPPNFSALKVACV